MVYLKPTCNSFSGTDVRDVVGPMQTTYVELQIFYQQIPQAQGKVDAVEKVIKVAKNEKLFIYDINDVA